MRRPARTPAVRRATSAWPGLTWEVTSDADDFELELRAKVETPDGVATIDLWHYDGGWRCAPSQVLDLGGGTKMVSRPEVRPHGTLAEAVFASRPKIQALAAMILASANDTGLTDIAKSFTEKGDADVVEQLRVARAGLTHLSAHGVP